MMQGFISDYKNWAAKPFSADMPVSQWFLFIGLLIVIVIFWNIMLRHLIEALKG